MAIVKISESGKVTVGAETSTLITDSKLNRDIAKQTVDVMGAAVARLDLLIKHNEAITGEIFTEEDIEDDSH